MSQKVGLPAESSISIFVPCESCCASTGTAMTCPIWIHHDNSVLPISLFVFFSNCKINFRSISHFKFPILLSVPFSISLFILFSILSIRVCVILYSHFPFLLSCHLRSFIFLVEPFPVLDQRWYHLPFPSDISSPARILQFCDLGLMNHHWCRGGK
jgi:hypothetical protein